jgi:cation-transporting ATPase 13A1
MKEALAADATIAQDVLDIESSHKVQTLWSGTMLQQVTAGSSSSSSSSSGGRTLWGDTPDGGCVCYVLRTGFSSSQGRLVRMVEYSSAKVMSDANETLALMVVLLMFAIGASSYVMRTGLAEGKRSPYELVLRCVFILTSVVPPELPMQTAVAVNAALMALWKTSIFCTEPFRIPYAGKISVALFDKTGTLTTDQLIAVGCASTLDERQPDRAIPPMNESSLEAAQVLAACHSLVEIDGKLSGDPLELAAIKSVAWDYKPSTQRAAPATPSTGGDGKAAATAAPARHRHTDTSVEVLHRYHFQSSLQRMSVLARVRTSSEAGCWALVKGSPEVIATLLSTVPAGYNSTYQHMAQNGLRVLALARRRLSGRESEVAAAAHNTGHAIPRNEVESNLQFVAFVAFSCLVRRDTSSSIRELQNGSHRVIMVTGDSPLTSIHVAKQVGIIRQQSNADAGRSLLLQVNRDTNALEWVSAHTSGESEVEAPEDEEKKEGDDEKVEEESSIRRRKQPKQIEQKSDTPSAAPTIVRPFVATDIPSLVKEGFDLSVTGASLRAAVEADVKTWLQVRHIAVYARMRPHDKEAVLRALKEQGEHTLMCGDGANDVGALKQAHVGIALLSGFGGANTAKPGDKPLEEETKEEKKARELVTKQHADKRAAEQKKNAAELKQMQEQIFRDELKRLQDAGEGWSAGFKAMKNATTRMVEEAKKRNADQQAKFGNNPLAAHAASMAADMETGEVPTVQIGDASMAAPFTSKLPSIKSCIDVIRQGRCTLVSTIQMQQILALNCLIAAYSLSAMYIDGVRSGEAQMIASGMLLTIASFAFTYARPVQELSPVRPITSLYHPAIWVSIVGQLLIHLSCMVFIVSLCKEYAPAEHEAIINSIGSIEAPVEPEPEPEPVAPVPGAELDPFAELFKDSKFKPSLLNTGVWLVETAQQVYQCSAMITLC